MLSLGRREKGGGGGRQNAVGVGLSDGEQHPLNMNIFVDNSKSGS